MKTLEELKTLADNLKRGHEPAFDHIDQVAHNLFTLGEQDDIQKGIEVLESLFVEALDFSKKQELKVA